MIRMRSDVTMPALKFTSIQAANADPACQAITAFIAQQLGQEFEFFAPLAWQTRERAFDAAEVQVCWMCGAVYARKLSEAEIKVELLAAPIMAAPRYQDRAIYFSDVVVRAESAFAAFKDLRGARWAYNEPNSHSGYAVTRWYLASQGYGNGFFGQTLGSGAHQRSLQMVLAGEVDASAIDSTVLETELLTHPEIASRLRVTESFGPSPIPPWVMHTDLPDTLKKDLRQTFASMHESEAGRAGWAAGQIDNFAPVADADYVPLREIYTIGRSVWL